MMAGALLAIAFSLCGIWIVLSDIRDILKNKEEE